MKKDQVVRIKIEDISTDGAGIGKMDGFALFIKDAVIGDLVEAKIMKVKKNYGFARLVKILEPSEHRIEPPCPVARQCGGCQIQAMDYAEQLRFKEAKVRNNLARIGGLEDIELEPIAGMDEPFRYRNKAQYPVGRSKDGRIITGFYAGRTHYIVENRDCLLGAQVNKVILDRVKGWMEAQGIAPYQEEDGTGLVRHVLIRYGFQTKEVMVCVIINGRSLPGAQQLVDSLIDIDGMTSISFNVNVRQTNVILGDRTELLWGRPYIEDYIGDVKYQISPQSFYQVNPAQTYKLYQKALEYAQLTGQETVWDLYCGIGTISLFLAQQAKQVYGVEVVPQAIEDARRNAALNGIENAEFYVGRAEEVLPDMYQKNAVYAEVIVVDPPRKGCEVSLLDTIVEMAPSRVVYVSCDSATLARDLKYLCERGYRVVRGQAVDQFPMSVHVETVVLLEGNCGRI